MKSLMPRRQVRIGNERQIVTPEELDFGMHIAIANVIPESSFTTKLIKAGGGLVGLVTRAEGESRRQAAVRGWQHKDGGLAPLWHGIVERTFPDRVSVCILGEAEPHSFKNFRVEPQDLPEVAEPYTMTYLHESMGLAPLTPLYGNGPVAPGLQPHPRFWNETVTLLVQN